MNIRLFLVNYLAILYRRCDATNSRIDRPTQSCIIGLSIGGAFVFLLLVVIPQRVGSSAAASRHFIFSFRNQSLPSSSETVSPIFNSQHETSFFPTRKVIVQSLVPAGAISIRVELFRIILRNRQCTLSGVEVRLNYWAKLFNLLICRKGTGAVRSCNL